MVGPRDEADDEDLGRRKLSSLPSRRRRVMDIVTRSRAVLELGAAKIRKMEDRPPPRLDDLTRTAKYQLFHKSLELVRRMASRRAIYADGVRMARVCMVDDFRLVAIEDLAGLATIKPVQLDRRAWKLSRSSERGLELCDSFMATLPRARREPPPPVDHRPRTRHERARSWATVFTQEAADTWALLAAIPERLSFAERQTWEAELLGESTAPPMDPTTKPQPVPAPTMNADDDLHHAFAALGYAGIGETDNATT